MTSRRWFVEAPAERLAGVRILIGLFAFGYAVARLPHFARFSRFDPASFQPVGPVQLLSTPLPEAATWAIAIATAIAGAAFTLGYRYRITGPLFGLLLLWVTSYASSWGMVFHTENLMVLQVLAIGFGPAAEAWSWDARSQPVPEPSGRYGWPLRLAASIAVLAYFMAGVAKLRHTGIDWVTTDFLRNYVAYDALRKKELGSFYSPLGAALASYPALWKPLAALSLTAELAAPLALLGGRITKVWVVVIMGFHAGVLALMMILFAYPLFGFAFLPFFEIERPLRRLRDWARRDSSESRSGSRRSPDRDPA